MSHTFFVIINFQFFKEILSDTINFLVYRRQILETTENIVISIFTEFFLLASSDNDKHMC